VLCRLDFHLMRVDSGPADPVFAFIRAASVAFDGRRFIARTLEGPDAILAANPSVATASIHTAAILGDDDSVRRLVALDPGSAAARDGLDRWDPLTCLCFSHYLRLRRSSSEGFVRAAEALLDAGASANTGFYWSLRQPTASGRYASIHQSMHQFWTVICGAAAVAQNPELTRLLLQRGADPNHGDTPGHLARADDAVLRIVVESGKLDAESVTTLIHGKLDRHDYEAVAWLLAHGVDPAHPDHARACSLALDRALDRSSELRFFELLMDHGADPTLLGTYRTFALAAMKGRADVLDLFKQRGFDDMLHDEAFVAACDRGDETTARRALEARPGLIARLQEQDDGLLARFAAAGNTAGVRLLLDFRFDPSFGSRAMGGNTALHMAAWLGHPETVELLVARGAPLEAKNLAGETPLSLAVGALAQRHRSMPQGSTQIVAILLDAGARRS
jgi:ankyrin repeat protein